MIKANPKDAVIRRQIESVEFGYVTFFLYLSYYGLNSIQLLAVD
jgi:hypothetical protein